MGYSLNHCKEYDTTEQLTLSLLIRFRLQQSDSDIDIYRYRCIFISDSFPL